MPFKPFLSTKIPNLGKHTLPLGFDNYVLISKVVSIGNPNSAKARALRKEADAEHRLIDYTHGRRMRSIILTVSNLLLLSAVHPETLVKRVEVICDKP